MPGEVLIQADGVGKKFCRDLKRSLWYGVKDLGTELTGRTGAKDRLRKQEFWAVDDVSFEVRRGECLGLIGHNGAGKSTLLKMLNGLIKPDRGSITMRGRIGALIELGAGFNPILTGRENVYVNGSVLGMTKQEIDAKFDAIVEFAEIGEFINAPVQSYSSGMKVRLGFAVAAQLEPDVLLIDEVLAVGDVKFRTKCYNRLAEMQDRCAFILVSHQMSHISFICDKTLLLKRGQTLFHGKTAEGVQLYMKENTSGDDKPESCVIVDDPIRSVDFRVGSDELPVGAPLHLDVDLQAGMDIGEVYVRLIVHDSGHQSVAELNTQWLGVDHRISSGASTIPIAINSLRLKPGDYHVSVFVHGIEGLRTYVSAKNCCSFRVEGPMFPGSSDYVLEVAHAD
ncbi:MAG: ABC transporter ATP-binding protein [Planctomycetota bacterium]